MTVSMHQIAAPVLRQMLGALDGVLAKGAAHAATHQLDPAVLLQTRLAPDMLPLIRQVQIATDMSKGAIARLAGLDVPSWPDEEATFDQLRARLGRTITYIDHAPAEQIDGSEARPVTIKTRQAEMHFSGQQYLLHFVIPNVAFHCATAYDILRHTGVELGKRDFIGAIPPA